jgi:hypothetical protein
VQLRCGSVVRLRLSTSSSTCLLPCSTLVTDVQEVLSRHAEGLFTAWLLPETTWPAESQEAGLQHNVSSWPAVQPLASATLAAMPAREAVHFLPRLAQLVSAAAEHAQACARHAAALAAQVSDADDQAAESPFALRQDAEDSSGLDSEVGSAGDAEPPERPHATAAHHDSDALHAVSAESAFTGFGRQAEMATWLLRRVPALFAALSRRNLGLLDDVCVFVRDVLAAQVRSAAWQLPVS